MGRIFPRNPEKAARAEAYQVPLIHVQSLGNRKCNHRELRLDAAVSSSRREKGGLPSRAGEVGDARLGPDGRLKHLETFPDVDTRETSRKSRYAGARERDRIERNS
jgi:hypothetical protein